MEIYLMRHGETNWNKEKKIQGSADIPLNEYGRELAEKTAEGLAGVGFDLIYTSPLIRAKETAGIIAADRKIPIIEDVRLQEMSFGSEEGADIGKSAADETSSLYHFLNRPDLYVPRDGESFHDVEERIKSFTRDVLAPGEKKGWSRILITAHGAFIRCFFNYIEDRPLADFWNGIPQKNCAVNLLRYEDGIFQIMEEGRVYY